MAKQFHLVIAVFFLALLVISCNEITYSPEKENNAEINRQPKTDLNINLSSMTDTLFIYESADITYTIDTKGKEFSKVNFYIDSLFAGTTTDTRNFYLDVTKLKSGSHKLKFEVWVHSGTGSLNDRFGNEYVAYSKIFNIISDNGLNKVPIKIDSVYFSDGSLRIAWQKYPYPDFEGYVIYCRAPGKDYFGAITSIDNRDQNFWLNDFYVGGYYEFRIDVATTSKSLSGKVKAFNDVLPHLYKLEKMNNDKVLLKWNKSKYYKNFQDYIVYRKYRGREMDSTKVAVIKNISDTTYTDDIYIGPDISYHIIVEGGNQSSQLRNLVQSNSDTLKTTEPFTSFDRLEYIPSLSSIYIKKNWTECLRLDAETFSIQARGKSDVNFSQNTVYAFSNNLYYSGDPPHSFTRVDPLSLQPIGNTITTNSFMKYYSTNSIFVVLDNGLCLYAGDRYSKPTEYGPPAVILLNTDPVKVLMKDSAQSMVYIGDSPMSVSRLTDEGQYVIVGSSILNVKDNAFTRKSIERGKALFLSSGKEYFVISTSNISFFKCSDNTLVRNFPIENSLINPVIDPATGYLGGSYWDPNKFVYRIYDLSEGKLIKEIKLVDTWNTPALYMANSCLFLSSGCYLKLNFTK